MRFGLFYEHQLPRPWTRDSEYRLLQDALEQIEFADELGIEFVWEVEHHFLEEYSHSSAPEVFLAAASQRTKRIRLGHGIVQASPLYNHPARVAERAATLDLLSNGRLELGTGESATTMEMDGFGVTLHEKEAQWKEGLHAVVRCMTETPFTGIDGMWVQMPPRNVVPKPRQQPHPPLWMACSRRDSIIKAAELGLGALTFAFIDPEDARSWVEAYERHLAHANPVGLRMDPELACVTPMMVHKDEREAVRRGLEGGNFFGYSLAYYIVFGDHAPGRSNVWDEFQRERRTRGYDPEAAIERELAQLGTRVESGGAAGLRGAVGTPDQLRDFLRRYEEAGVDQLIFVLQAGTNRHEHILESLELFGREILPEFQERDVKLRKEKAARLEPWIDAALARRSQPAPAADPGYRVQAIAKQLYRGAGGQALLDQIAADSATGQRMLGIDVAAGGKATDVEMHTDLSDAGPPSGGRFEFLSPGWFKEADALRAQINPPVPAAIQNVKIDVIVTGGPDGDIEASLVAGRFKPGLSQAPVKMVMPYDIAHRMFIAGDDQTSMQAMMRGEIKVEGDITVLMALQMAGAPSAEAEELQARIRGMTE